MRVENRQYLTLLEGDLDTLGADFLRKFAVQDADIVRLFPVARSTRTARITGPVATPGEYAIEPGGNQAFGSHKKGGRIKLHGFKSGRVNEGNSYARRPCHSTFAHKPGKSPGWRSAKRHPSGNERLHFVRTVPEWDLYATVTISGEVKYPGVYTVKRVRLCPIS